MLVKYIHLSKYYENNIYDHYKSIYQAVLQNYYVCKYELFEMIKVCHIYYSIICIS